MHLSARATGAVLVLALVATLPFLPGLPGAFLFDDYHVIVDNRALVVEDFAPGPVLDAALSTRTGMLKRPLALLSFALDRKLHGLAPAGWKLTNIAIHALNALLVFALLRVVLPRLLPAADAGHCARLAWVAAALWAVHPLNLTSVLYIVQRMTSLCATFMLATLLSYACLRSAPGLSRGQVLRRLGLIALFSLAALLTKETALLLPLYGLVLEALVFRFRGLESWRVPALLGAALCAGGALAWLAWRPEVLLSAYASRDFTLSERLLTEARVVIGYLRWLMLPEPAAFGLFHDDIPLSRDLVTPPTTLPAILAVTVMVALCGARRWPLVAFACAWFLGGHVLESSVWPLEIAHEHRNYLPGIGVLLALVVGAARVCPAHWRRPLALVVLALAAGLTGLRAHGWRDASIQAELEVAHHPRSARAHYELGRVRYARALAQGSPHAPAAAAFERAAELGPNSPMPLAALLRVALIARDEPALERLLDRVRRLPHASAQAWIVHNVVECQVSAHCPVHGPATRALVEATLERVPAASPAGRVALEWLAIFYLRLMGDAEAGRRVLEDLVASAPQDLSVALRLGEALVAGNERDAALTLAHAVGERLPWHAPWSERPRWRRWQRLLAAAQALGNGGDG